MPDVCHLCHRTKDIGYLLPCRDVTTPQRFSLVSICEICVVRAVDNLRDIVRRARQEEYDASSEAEMDMLMLIDFLKASGREITYEHIQGSLGMEVIRHGLEATLDSLERQIMCSGCNAVVPESRLHVIPHFNESHSQYVTTYCCERCFPRLIQDTLERVRTADSRTEFDGLGKFFQRHGVFVHEWMRGDSVEQVRPLFIATLENLVTGAIVLLVGATLPLATVNHPKN